MHLWLFSISAGIEIMIITVRLQTVCPATVPLKLHHQMNLHFGQWHSFALHMDYQTSLANATSRTTNGNQNASDTEVLSLDYRFSINLQIHVRQFSLLTWQKTKRGTGSTHYLFYLTLFKPRNIFKTGPGVSTFLNVTTLTQRFCGLSTALSQHEIKHLT